MSPDSTQIASFLGTTIETGLHLCSIVPDGAFRGRWFGEDIAAATDWAVAENNRGKNLYWTVNLAPADLNTKPSRSDIVAARFVHVDIDPPKNADVLDKLMIQAQLKTQPVPPTLIVDSGGGLQAFWRLAGTPALEAVEAVNQNVAARWDGDRCYNIDRLMRLPGTINYPNARKRAAGRSTSFAKVIHDKDRVLD